MSLRYGNGHLSESYQASPYSVTGALHSWCCTLYPLVRYLHCLDGMTLWLSFGSQEFGQVLPLVRISHLSPATSWILQSWSLRYGNGRLSESYQACPYSVTGALHS